MTHNQQKLKYELEKIVSFQINIKFPQHKQTNSLSAKIKELQNESLDNLETEDKNNFNLFCELRNKLRNKLTIKENEIEKMSEDKILIALKDPNKFWEE